MNYLDLFHGIGGFALGAYWAGMKFDNHFCSDIEKYTIELYKKRFPDSIQLGDITKINFEKLKKDYTDEWIITGGFPCQDISIAGKGNGLIDEKGNKTRSGLWFDYWRAIRTLRPRFVIIENVRALLNRGMEIVIGNLAEIGYNAEWQIISAEDMGAPHKRERVWILAYPQGIGNRHDDDKGDKRKSSDRQKWPKVGSNINFGSKNTGEIFNTSKNRLEKSRNDIRNGTALADSDNPGKRTSGNGIDKDRQEKNRKVKPQPEFSGQDKMANAGSNGSQGEREKRNPKRQAGLYNRKAERSKTGWTVEPAVGRLVNGLSGRVDRLKGLGNSIIPQIAELLFNQIKEQL